MLMLMLERRKSLFVSLSLTVLMMTLLVGCRTISPKPTKPVIKMEQTDDGGMCLDKENTRRLSDYIFRLENWVEDVE